MDHVGQVNAYGKAIQILLSPAWTSSSVHSLARFHIDTRWGFCNWTLVLLAGIWNEPTAAGVIASFHRLEPVGSNDKTESGVIRSKTADKQIIILDGLARECLDS
jgi:hypothetical protein